MERSAIGDKAVGFEPGVEAVTIDLRSTRGKDLIPNTRVHGVRSGDNPLFFGHFSPEKKKTGEIYGSHPRAHSRF
jgi:hypothetical protein